MQKHSGLIFMLVLALVLAVPAVSSAGWSGCPGAWGDGADRRPWLDMNAEQRAGFERILEEYRGKSQAMHSELAAKNMELEYLSATGKIEAKAISAMVHEIKTLRDGLYNLREGAAEALRKELSLPLGQAQAILEGFLPRHGGGCRFFGEGYGDGRHRSGENYGRHGGHGGRWHR